MQHKIRTYDPNKTILIVNGIPMYEDICNIDTMAVCIYGHSNKEYTLHPVDGKIIEL